MPHNPPLSRTFTLGEFKIIVISDGSRGMGIPSETYGIGQPIEAINDLLQSNFLPTDQFVTGFAPVLVDTGVDVILFDTGFGEMGASWGAGRLMDGLAANGYSPDQITVVAMTHLHMDHFAGLMTAGQPTFKNARYVIGQKEFDFWIDPARMGTPMEQGHQGVLARVAPLKEKTTFIGEGDDVVPGIQAIEAFGHSPGHLIYRLQSGAKSLLLTGDTVNHFVLSLQRPGWHVRFDFDKDAAAATRYKILSMIAEERIPFIGYHMPFPCAGYVEKVGDTYRYIPVTYQLDV